MAQDDDIQRRNINVTVVAGGEKKYQTVQYATFKKYSQAVDAKNKLKAAITKDNDPSGTGLEFENTKKKLGLILHTSLSSGQIKNLTLMDGQGVLILAESSAMNQVEAIDIRHGITDYNCTVKIETSIKEITVTGQQSNSNPVIKKVPGMDTGSDVSFNVNIVLPPGYATDDTRLIIQPMAIDCQTEDTVAYLPPVVYESANYHKLQDRRMNFDFDGCDPLAVGYDPSVVLAKGKPIVVNTNVNYHKEDKEKTYKGAYRCVLEDYHHLIYDNGGEGTGSCLSFKPFKFLNFGVAAAELPLTEEFQQQPEENFQTIPRDLKLKFEVGKDVLSSDSLNQVELHNLVKELKAYGEKLMRVSIQGTSSPEGSIELNSSLAAKRSNVARDLLRRYMGNGVTIRTETPRVFTWNDVLAEVEKKNDSTIVNMVRNTIANYKPNEVFGLLKNMPFFESAIVPVLESQRIMKCSYIYDTQHIMDANEVVAAYYMQKPKLLSGEKDFSDGDYYNLFASIQDSTELDTITVLAYKHVTKQPGYVNLKFAPYAANRMALLNIRRGMPDLGVLRPFVDFNVRKINQKKAIDAFNSRIINREELLINQAVTYFQDGKLDSASYILNDWVPRTERTKKMRMYVTFSYNYIKMLQGDLEPEKLADTREAANYVLSSGDENRAILYSELHGQLGKSRRECEEWIDRLPDSNPKKWYLKGLVWSEEAGKEPPVEGDDDGFRELDDMEYMDLQMNNPEALAKYNEELEKHRAAKAKEKEDKTPYFLAYFQHSFDLEPKYKRLYYNEGNVSDDIREKFPYRKKDIPAYRKRFNNLIKQRDRLKEAQAAQAATENAQSGTTAETGTPAADTTAPATGTNAPATTEQEQSTQP